MVGNMGRHNVSGSANPTHRRECTAPIWSVGKGGGGGGGAGQIPCRDFQRGFCGRGAECRFAH